MRARKHRTLRTIFALILREISTTYGKSPGGYLWAVLEPTLALAVLSAIFSMAVRNPPLGESFALFYATGYLPFMAFNDVANKSATSLNYSKPLLQYPAVTFIDALLARAVLHILTHVLIAYIIFCGLALIMGVDIKPNYPMLALGYVLAACVGFGIGCFNCFVMMSFPVWERIWQILTRPLIFISGLFLPYEAMPDVAQDILWWNPLIHIVGFVRTGIYDFYEGDYLSLLFPLMFSFVTMVLGLLLLWRHHNRLLES